MDALVRTRLEQLEALIDAAPSPIAWVRLCAALSEWPDHDRLELGIEFVRARMHAWPRALRSAPEWWRMAWERSIPEPRLVLAGTLAGPLLPAKGGGSCPVQHDLYYRDRIYYVRFRHDHLSVDLERVGETTLDRELFAADLSCIETQSIGLGGSWSDEETNVMLSLISAAIRANAVSQLAVPDSIAALQASEHYMRGPYPLLVARLGGGDDTWSTPFQPCNGRWIEQLRRGGAEPAIQHHLAQTRPATLGPMPPPTCRVWFPWSPWSNPQPDPPERELCCEVRLLRRSSAADASVQTEQPQPQLARVWLDDRREVWVEGRDLIVHDHDTGRSDRRHGHRFDIRACVAGPGRRVVTCDEYGELRVWDIDGDTSVPLANSRNELPDLAFLGDGRIVAVDDAGLRVWDPQSGACQADFACELEVVSLASAGNLVVVGHEDGSSWVFEIEPAIAASR